MDCSQITMFALAMCKVPVIPVQLDILSGLFNLGKAINAFNLKPFEQVFAVFIKSLLTYALQ